MRVNQNRFSISAYSGVRQAADLLYKSMHKLSTGTRLTKPGDAPADYGIAQKMRFQIRNSTVAHRNIEDARNLIHTSDAWLQSTHDMLHRMGELATAANDGSKNASDMETIKTEFEQLRSEIRRIGREAKYNGVQVAGRDQILSYDQDKESFFFSQIDGKESYHLNTKVLSGIKGTNNTDFLFDSSKDFTLDSTGRYIFYVDSNDNLTKYDIDTGAIARDTTDSEDKGLEVDNYGRLWYATESPPASGNFSVRQQGIDNWAQDTGILSNADITDLGSKEFKIYENRIYYLDTSDNIVSRSLDNVADVTVELEASEHSFTTTQGQFAISEDGQYITDVSSPGVIRVTNVVSKQSNSFDVGPGITVANLTFSVDTGEVAYVDSVENSIHRVKIELGDMPVFGVDEKLHTSSGSSGFTGLSLDGGSHRARFRVQHGPDAGQDSVLSVGDVRLHTLGLSRISLNSVGDAQKALDAIQVATQRVSIQRSKLGGQESRLTQTHSAMAQYVDNLTVSESAIRDVDIAAESTAMMDLQVRYQAATAILAQANQQSQTVLRLLNR